MNCPPNAPRLLISLIMMSLSASLLVAQDWQSCANKTNTISRDGILLINDRWQGEPGCMYAEFGPPTFTWWSTHTGVEALSMPNATIGSNWGNERSSADCPLPAKIKDIEECKLSMVAQLPEGTEGKYKVYWQIYFGDNPNGIPNKGDFAPTIFIQNCDYHWWGKDLGTYEVGGSKWRICDIGMNCCGSGPFFSPQLEPYAKPDANNIIKVEDIDMKALFDLMVEKGWYSEEVYVLMIQQAWETFKIEGTIKTLDVNFKIKTKNSELKTYPNWTQLGSIKYPSIELDCPTTTILPGASLPFSLEMIDGASGNVTWNLSGGGTLGDQSSGGATFISDGSLGEFTVTATLGDMQRQKIIRVMDPQNIHLKLNCGGPDVGDWISDEPYAVYGLPADKSNQISHEGMPEQIWKTERYGMPGFAIDLPNGTYTIRMHFAEGYVSGAGQRVFDVYVEDEKIPAVDPYALAGGQGKPHTLELSKAVSDSTLNIDFEQVAQLPTINALEVILQSPVGAKNSARPAAAHQPQSANFHYVPGPNDAATIAVTAQSPYTLELFSADGKKLAQFSDTRSREFALPGHKSSSMYLLRLTTDDKVITRQMMIP